MTGVHPKWSALAAACVALFWPGAFIFGFPGVMGSHWQAAFGVGQAAVGLTLFYVLAAVGLFMFLTGRWQEKIGAPGMAALGAILCGLSTIMVSRAAGIKQVYLWAFLTGASSSFVYLPALTVVQRWFPHRRGLVSGLVNMVFALSAAIMSPGFVWLWGRLGYRNMTLVLGLIALISGVIAARFLRSPQPSQEVVPPAKPGVTLTPGLAMTLTESVGTANFWWLWLVFGLAGAAGIAMVTLSTAFGLSRGLTPQAAVVILISFNLTSGLSRLIAGYLSDVIGRSLTMCLAFLLAGAAYLVLPYVTGLVVWAFLAGAVGLAFGALFAVSAPLAVDCFGIRHFGAIFGLIFTGYGLL
ncbi:MAG: MFS transporter, partial [Deltaproteobacteria bacterium]|nr:MFS transporter [Deltaproteobacteria bacterium]